MESHRYRHTASHSRNPPSSQFFQNDQEYNSNDHQSSNLVTPTSQITGGRSRHAGHHDHHHHHHHHYHHHRSREGPTPFDDDGDNSGTDNDAIQRDLNGGFGDYFEIPHRMLRIIMPELFE